MITGFSQYRVELLAPATNAFVPDMSHKDPSHKGKARANRASEVIGEDEHVYASQFIEITTDVRQDEPFPLAFVKGTE